MGVGGWGFGYWIGSLGGELRWLRWTIQAQGRGHGTVTQGPVIWWQPEAQGTKGAFRDPGWDQAS